jgi:hypothetical protein
MLQHIDDLQTQVTSDHFSPMEPMQTLKYRGVTYGPQSNHKFVQPSADIEWGVGQQLMYRGISYTVVSQSVNKVSASQAAQVLCYRGTPYVSSSPTHDLPYATA